MSSKTSANHLAHLPGPAERVELVRVAQMVGAVPIVATRGARGTGGPLLRRLVGDGSDPKAVETSDVDRVATGIEVRNV